MKMKCLRSMKLLMVYGCQEFLSSKEDLVKTDAKEFKKICLTKLGPLLCSYNTELIRIEGSRDGCLDLQLLEKNFGDCMIARTFKTISSVVLFARQLLAREL
jgi:hypothetical protein